MQVKKRTVRVEREQQAATVLEDENAHLWAVSYSDFLMALLSFFILFFSVDSSQRENIILNLANSFAASGSTGVAGAGGAGTASGTGQDGKSETGRLPANVMDALSSLQISVAKDRESLVVHFPDDFFDPGQHRISQSHTPVIDKFLSVLHPHRNDVNLYFEGHADQTPLNKAKNGILVDNFVLSSLRGSAALRIARDVGFPEKNLFVQAASSNLRNSRSLSIRIEPKERRTQ